MRDRCADRFLCHSTDGGALMSQLLEPPMAEQQQRLPEEPSAPAGFGHSLDPAEAEFAYRPVPMSAIVGLVLALLSTSALMAWMSIPLAAMAAVRFPAACWCSTTSARAAS